jgi:PIN domain nuclease of toxin-antitoxin system
VRLLLDTHAFVWAVEAPDRLPPAVRGEIEDPGNPVWVSVASVWEAGTKARLGRLRLSRPIDVIVHDALVGLSFSVLDVRLGHVIRLLGLPPLHGDPFDRIIVAQAIEERLTLVTSDLALHEYPVDHLW